MAERNPTTSITALVEPKTEGANRMKLLSDLNDVLDM